MAFYYGYPYPPEYAPEPWRTTYIPRHYPEKHYPLEHFRHMVGHTLSNVADGFVHPFGTEQPIHTPRIDIRESKSKYYIDIELPGLEVKENLTIKWLNARTLLLETKMERPKIEEDEPTGEQTNGNAAAAEPSSEVITQSNKNRKDDSNIDENDHTKGKDTALTVHERHIGGLARAFSFPTEVSHEQLEANLHAGLLRMKVPKKEINEVMPEHKEVKVKHSGA